MADQIKFKAAPSTAMVAGPTTPVPFTTEKMAELKSVAAGAGIPISELIRQMVDFALANRCP